MLKEEIARLAKRALRVEVDAMRKSSAQHRRHIAALKRQVAQLEREVASLGRRAAASATAPQRSASARRVRFVAKGLRSQRARLGLSADAFGKLAGVSAQTIYNWEHEVSHPRREQLARLVALRALGKREAARRLEALAS